MNTLPHYDIKSMGMSCSDCKIDFQQIFSKIWANFDQKQRILKLVFKKSTIFFPDECLGHLNYF